MSATQHIKLGYIREPESHEMFFPYTHVSAIIGLTQWGQGLLGDYLPIAGGTMTGALHAPTIYITGHEDDDDSETSLLLANGSLLPYEDFMALIGATLVSVANTETDSSNPPNSGLELQNADGETIGSRVTVPTSALRNDTATGNAAVTIIINGNF